MIQTLQNQLISQVCTVEEAFPFRLRFLRITVEVLPLPWDIQLVSL